MSENETDLLGRKLEDGETRKRYSKPLSASSIETFLQCEAKFANQYLLRLARENDSEPLKFGRAFHDALESAENKLKDAEFDTIPSNMVADFIAEYRELCVKHKLSNFTLINEGETLLKEYFNNFDSSDKVIETEYFFKIKTKLGVRIIGAIDKLVELDPETVVVVDYKTGNYAKTESELTNDIQLSMYDLAVRYDFPQYKNVILMLHYVKKQPVCTYRTDEDRENFEQFLFDVDKRIRALTVEDAKESKNRFCPWCDFKDICKSYTDVYNKVSKFPELAINENTTEEEAITILENLDINSKIIDERKRAVKFWISQQHTNKGTPVSFGNKEAKVRQNGRTTHDAKALYDIMPLEDFLKSVSVRSKDLENFLSSNPKYREQVEKAASYNYSDFYVKVGKK